MGWYLLQVVNTISTIVQVWTFMPPVGFVLFWAFFWCYFWFVMPLVPVLIRKTGNAVVSKSFEGKFANCKPRGRKRRGTFSSYIFLRISYNTYHGQNSWFLWVCWRDSHLKSPRVEFSTFVSKAMYIRKPCARASCVRELSRAVRCFWLPFDTRKGCKNMKKLSKNHHGVLTLLWVYFET